MEFIGLDEELKQNKQIILISDSFFINNGVQVFSNVVQREPRSKSNSGLLKEHKGELKTTGSVCHEHQHHDECGE